MTAFFYTLSRWGKLRCTAEFEMAGLDKSKHGGTAYSWRTESMGKGANSAAVDTANVTHHNVIHVGRLEGPVNP
jgi:hypothetical protein